MPKAFRKRILEELFVRASPKAVDSAIKASNEIDEAKLKKLLHDINHKI